MMVSNWLLTACFVGLAASQYSDGIENGLLGEPRVGCESNAISLHFDTKNTFHGKIFVKGFVNDNECLFVGNGATNHSFEVKHDSCGVRRQREVNGVVISATVIISFHSIFITKVDRAYRVSCFYVEGSKKVHNHLDISALTTQLIESQTQLPVCKYEILNDAGGSPIKYARIGDNVYHKWTCIAETDDIYCMRVHSCTVYDGQGGAAVTVIDNNGCSVDGVILQDLDYLSDLSAGKSAPVFKFADKAGLYFNCQIQLTIKDKDFGCTTTQPQCTTNQYIVDAADRTTEIGSEYNTEGHESGYPTRPANYDTTEAYAEPSSPAPPPSGLESTYLTAADQAYENSYNESEQPFTTSSAYTDDSMYGRLIKRNVEKTPITVADVDLPERGILVFGLEEVEEGDNVNSPSASKSSEKTCFNTNRMYGMLVILCALFVITIVAFIAIVHKQRQILAHTAFFKA